MPATRRSSDQKGSRRQNGRAAIHDLVYQEIRHSLMAGTFAPGEKVSLRSLAQQVGTSLTPVRGAVNRLIAEGAFEVLPNRWVMIPPMTEEKFEEITYWRVQLESEATRRAADHFTPALLKEITAINQRMVKAVQEKGDRHNVLTGNYDFHFAIYRASQSTILLPMIESLWLQVGPFTYYSLLSPRELWDAKYHEAIINALKAGDGETAATAVKNDILNTAKFLKSNKQYSHPKLRRVVG
jgi:DNA-binding GntR family transcriptional regulator